MDGLFLSEETHYMLLEQQITKQSSRIVRPSEARCRIGVSRAKFADMVAKGHFPKPFVIVPGGRAVGWLEHEIDEWIDNRSRDQQGEVA